MTRPLPITIRVNHTKKVENSNYRFNDREYYVNSFKQLIGVSEHGYSDPKMSHFYTLNDIIKNPIIAYRKEHVDFIIDSDKRFFFEYRGNYETITVVGPIGDNFASSADALKYILTWLKTDLVQGLYINNIRNIVRFLSDNEAPVYGNSNNVFKEYPFPAAWLEVKDYGKHATTERNNTQMYRQAPFIIPISRELPKPLTEINGIVHVAVVSNEVNDVYKPMKDTKGFLVLERLDNTVFDFSAVKVRNTANKLSIGAIQYKKHLQHHDENQQRDPNLIIEITTPKGTIFLELADPVVVYNRMQEDQFVSYITSIITHLCNTYQITPVSTSRVCEVIASAFPEQPDGRIPDEHLPPVDKTITKAEAIYLLCDVHSVDKNEVKKCIDEEKYDDAISIITATMIRNHTKEVNETKTAKERMKEVMAAAKLNIPKGRTIIDHICSFPQEPVNDFKYIFADKAGMSKEEVDKYINLFGYTSFVDHVTCKLLMNKIKDVNITFGDV